MADTGSGIVAAGRSAALLPERRPHLAAPPPADEKPHSRHLVRVDADRLPGRRELHRTTNAGRTWTEPVSTGRPMTQVDFADARNGYVVVPRVGLEARGFVLRRPTAAPAGGRSSSVRRSSGTSTWPADPRTHSRAPTSSTRRRAAATSVRLGRSMITTGEGGSRSPPRSPSAAGSPPPWPGSRRSSMRVSGSGARRSRRRLERHVRHPLARFQEVCVRWARARHGRPHRSRHQAAHR